MSARNHGLPVPSTTRPFLITRSYGGSCARSATRHATSTSASENALRAQDPPYDLVIRNGQRRRVLPRHDVELLIGKSFLSHGVDEQRETFGRQRVRLLTEIRRHDDRGRPNAPDLLGE